MVNIEIILLLLFYYLCQIFFISLYSEESKISDRQKDDKWLPVSAGARRAGKSVISNLHTAQQ